MSLKIGDIVRYTGHKGNGSGEHGIIIAIPNVHRIVVKWFKCDFVYDCDIQFVTKVS